ncbi:TatD family hydrolase [Rubritalea tangerina]|uniref:TatD family hydrolase n=2 Tax=Rubritalea tangerina TaxID=430798 RepID=A0ABW4ZAY5_9BACT
MDTSLSFFDAHNHLQDARLTSSPDLLISKAQSAGIKKMVVNGTSPSDWPSVSDLATKFPDIIVPSFGLHPWHTPSDENEWLPQLKHFLAKHPIVGVGECGLDRWMPNPHKENQIRTFTTHLELAAQNNLPLSIHVLKAWGWLIETLHQNPLPSRGFLLHSFGGSRETARELLDLGAYFSFSGYFLHPKKKNVQDVFKYLPPDRVLIETDAPDMLPPQAFYSDSSEHNSPINLSGIYHGFSQLLEVPIQQLANQVTSNFEHFFLETHPHHIS